MGVKEMIILICKDDFNSVYICSFLPNYARLGCAVYCMLIILQSPKNGENFQLLCKICHMCNICI